MNVKDVVNRLRLHKKDIQEIFVTVTNQKKDGELDTGWCLVEFHLSLESYGSVLYRNACEIEQASKDFNPIVYYTHLHSNKQPFLVIEPGKLEFLEKTKNEFVEWLVLPDKVEFSSQTSKLKYTVKPESCFKKYEYERFANLYEGVNTLTNPPHHLQRYTEICSKNARDMMVYVNNKPPKDGSIKFFCAMKSEQLLFILKFKMKICESRIIIQNSYHTTAAVSRVANALDTSMSNQMHPSSSNYIPAIRHSMHSMEVEVKSSYQQAPSPIEFPNSNSSPNFFISNPSERQSTEVSKHKRKHESQVTQDYELKKTKKNGTNMIAEDDEDPPIKISLDKRKNNNQKYYPVVNSNEEVTSSVEILTSKEAFNKAHNNNNNANSRSMKYENIQREQQQQQHGSNNSHSYINQYQYNKKQPQQQHQMQQPIIEKKQEPSYPPRYSENSNPQRQLTKAGMSEVGDSLPKYESRHNSTMSTDFTRSIFETGPKGNHNAFGLQPRGGAETLRKPVINSEQTERINQNFSKKLKDSLRDMKL